MKVFGLNKLILGVICGLSVFLAACDVGALPEEVELSTLGTFTCRTTLNGGTRDNIVVPDNATCTLNNTKVEGNIVVKTGATLIAKGVLVDGNIQSEGHARVTVIKSTLRKSQVGGSIQLKQGKRANVLDTIIDGSLQVEQNRGLFNFSRNTIGSDLQAFSNRGTGLTISSNRIDGNLQCKSNNPAPTGSGNIVQGNKEDQCAGL